MNPFIYFDFEVMKKIWIVVFKQGDNYQVINDIQTLKQYIEEHKKNIFIGFNNYGYDNYILAGLLLNKNPYEISELIINKQIRPKFKLNLLSLDVMQELPLGVGLKSSQGNMRNEYY